MKLSRKLLLSADGLLQKNNLLDLEKDFKFAVL